MEVITPVFEGPFEVLLQLVLDHKVDVCDIPIAPVVEGFLKHISETKLDLTEASEFLVIAAVLVELKSRKLLPGPDEIESDEEFIGLEQRDILLARLVELQAYSAAAIDFSFLIEQAGRSLPRTAGLDEDFTILAPDLLAGVGPTEIQAAYRRATVARPQPVVDLSHVTVEVVSVSETVAELEAYLPGTGEVTFRELTAHLKTRMQVIVRFLALLELHKRGRSSSTRARRSGICTSHGSSVCRLPCRPQFWSVPEMGRTPAGDQTTVVLASRITPATR